MHPLALLALPAAFAAELTPEAQVRPRWEGDTVRDGTDDEDPVSTTTLRTRLGATLSEGDLHLRLVLSDVRVIGTQGHTLLDHDADHLDLRIATATWSPGPWSVVIGRDTDSIHNQRLVGATDWAQTARTFEGARVARKGERLTVDARVLVLAESDALSPEAGFQATDQPDVPRDSLLSFVSAD